MMIALFSEGDALKVTVFFVSVNICVSCLHCLLEVKQVCLAPSVFGKASSS